MNQIIASYSTIIFLLVSKQQHVASGWLPSMATLQGGRCRNFVYRTRFDASWFDPQALFSSSSDKKSQDDETSFSMPSAKTSVAEDKTSILQVAAALDRGAAYNPTSGSYYSDSIKGAKEMLRQFIDSNPDRIPQSIDELVGEFELVLTTYPKGIYRSSPTFLAVQESLRHGNHNDYESSLLPSFLKMNMTKTDLFYKAHQFQTNLLKTNKVGRVAHYITKDTLYSEFDTALLNIQAIIPVISWFKFLPEVGGSLVTASHVHLDDGGVLNLQLDYTTPRKLKGIWGKGNVDWRIRVGDLWQKLPWNKGRPPIYKLFVRYADETFHILENTSGDYFVYTKPVMPRPLDLVKG